MLNMQLTELIDWYNDSMYTVVSHTARACGKDLRKYVTSFLADNFHTDDMNISRIPATFLGEFGRYLSARDLSCRTVDRQQRLLNRVLHSVDDNGNISGDIVIRKYVTNSERLSEGEFAAILNADLPSRRLQRVRDLFLFSCFTGLKYDEMLELTPTNLTAGLDGSQYLTYTRRMTGATVRIPLLPIPQRIIDKYRGRQDETLLPVITLNCVNAYLRELAAISGVKKRITFSAARDIFSALACNNGIPPDILSALMGEGRQRTDGCNMKQITYYFLSLQQNLAYMNTKYNNK